MVPAQLGKEKTGRQHCVGAQRSHAAGIGPLVSRRWREGGGMVARRVGGVGIGRGREGEERRLREKDSWAR
jgi:hypothetical protein